MTADELIAKLGDSFTTRIAGEGSDLAPTIWDEIETDGDQGTLGLFTAKDERWVLARITAGRPRPHGRGRLGAQRRLAGAGREHSASAGDRHAAGSQGPAQAARTCTWWKKWSRGSTRTRFPLAALVMPATVDHIRTISEHGERMPAKSTYFYPKLLSGLVINPLE